MKNMFGACPSFVKEVIAYDLKQKIAAPVMSAAMSGLLNKWEFFCANDIPLIIKKRSNTTCIPQTHKLGF